MGFNTTVLVLNDALGNIERDKEFGRNLTRAVLDYRPGESNYISSFGHVNAASIRAMDHADTFRGLVIGSNTSWDMGRAGGWSEKFRDDMDESARRLYFLQRMADTLGYRLVKKSKR